MNSPHCFVVGTLVCTVDGEVPIEDIEVGDYVLAENPDTGEIDYKPVLETYEHDTYDVVYLTIDGEEFTTTEGHPFYTLERGFVKAGELRYSGTLVDAKGNKLYLEKKNKEHLSEPVTVYNFAVEDYHTYFVGENDVLVHNMCATSNHSESIPLNQVNKMNTPGQSALIKLAKEAKSNGGATIDDAKTLIGWAKEYGVKYHNIEIHPNRPGAASNILHFHIGKTGHIPIIWK